MEQYFQVNLSYFYYYDYYKTYRKNASRAIYDLNKE